MVETVFLYRSMFSGIPPPFACSWPTCCRTWAWCCRSLTKILTWEKTERNKEIIIPTKATLLAKSRETSEYKKPFTIKARNKQTTKQRTRLKVTVCLYLNPNNSARSLSTLMAVAVVRENPQKKKLREVKVKSKICQFPLETSIKKAAKSGWSNNANTKISNSQAAEQTFRWRMNRRHFVKRNEDQSVAECCGESKKNVQRKNQHEGWPLFNHPVNLN